MYLIFFGKICMMYHLDIFTYRSISYHIFYVIAKASCSRQGAIEIATPSNLMARDHVHVTLPCCK